MANPSAALPQSSRLVQANRDHRFRAFLLTSLKHFLANEFDAASAQQRGGGQGLQGLQFDDGEDRYGREPADERSPDDAFDAQWAAQVFAAARARLEGKHRQGWMRGSRFFAPLLQQVLDDRDESFSEMAAQLQTSDGSLRVIAHRVRQQFGVCLREVIADTVETPEAVDDELRHLMTAVGQRPR